MTSSVHSLSETIVITSRYCGPAESGNGGYTCGRLAARLPGIAEVTLRRPPPLDTGLSIVGRPQDGAALMQGDDVVAEARPASLAMDVLPCPGLAAAADGSARYHGFVEHAFPACFVCGPERHIGDGLRIFAGDVDGGGLVASPWTPQGWLGDADGVVRPEFVWAALDCPGAWAWLAELDDPLVLGRLTASLEAPVTTGRPHIVGGWRLGQEGRKFHSGTAVWRADGTLCARAKATWIQVDQARFARQTPAA